MVQLSSRLIDQDARDRAGAGRTLVACDASKAEHALVESTGWKGGPSVLLRPRCRREAGPAETFTHALGRRPQRLAGAPHSPVRAHVGAWIRSKAASARSEFGRSGTGTAASSGAEAGGGGELGGRLGDISREL